jgi:Ty3 transposon capsid-like protein
MATHIQQLEANINFLESECQKQASLTFTPQPTTGAPSLADVIAAITKAIAEKKDRARVPAPTEYDGSKEKLPIFMKEMKAWLEDNKVTEGEEKIRLTLAYMKKDEAAMWSTQVAEDGMMWKTYSEFLDAVRTRFGDLDPKYTVHQKLLRTKQTGSVEAYSTEFRKYVKKTGFSNEDLANKYQRGLNNEIIQHIYHTGTLPISLNGWIKSALLYDRLSEQLHQLCPSTRNTATEKVKYLEPQLNKPLVHAESDYKPGTVGPMNIDTARHEGKCCHCRQPWVDGHTCEKKKAVQATYEKRQQVDGQRKEMRMEVNYEEMMARLKDELEVVKKELAAAKDEGD